MPIAFVFPGQGSQYVGMGAALDRATFEEADDALGMPLSRVIAEGPAERLAETEITQPAIFTVSVAMLRRLRAERPDVAPVAAAGHSLGEYAALVSAGALAFADAVRLLRLRGRAMQAAVPLGRGAMAAVVGLDSDRVQALCGDGAEVAAWNCPGQVVVAGWTEAVGRVIAAAEAAGGVAKRLQVSAPFHCALLTPAGEALRAALAETRVGPCAFPVVHNVDGDVASDADDIRRRLVDQVSRPVRWEACVRALAGFGADHLLEIGPGRTLAGLVRRIDRGLRVEPLDR